MKYPAAIWRPTPKFGYPNATVCLGIGIVAHSMEGSLTAAFGELDNPNRGASWHFSVAKNGDVYQHIETQHISWASGSVEANRRFWSIEHEGKAGEPLTPAQTAATTALMGWLLDSKNLSPKRGTTLWEHNEMTQFGSAATACPSGRIPWDKIIGGLDMPLTQDDLDKVRSIVKQELEVYIGDPAHYTQGRKVLEFLNESDDYVIGEINKHTDEVHK